MMEGGIFPNPAPAAANSQTYKILHLPGLSYLHAIPVVHTLQSDCKEGHVHLWTEAYLLVHTPYKPKDIYYFLMASISLLLRTFKAQSVHSSRNS